MARKTINNDDRRHVFIRDGFRCRYCGAWQFPWSVPTPEIDHIVPVAKRGPSRMSNYALACRDCNRRKGDNIWQPRPLTPWGYVVSFIFVLTKLVEKAEYYG